MILSKKDKKLLFSLILFTFLLIANATGVKEALPNDLERILYTPTITPTKKSEPNISKESNPEFTVITKVIDGDTIIAKDGKRIRYIGIDSPESEDPRSKIQCFAHEASARNEELVLGKTVRLEKDESEVDRYGRLLRYVYLDDLFINKQLVLEGFAHSSSYPPDIKHQNILDEAEQTAKENKRGLWLNCLN